MHTSMTDKIQTDIYIYILIPSNRNRDMQQTERHGQKHQRLREVETNVRLSVILDVSL